MIPAAGFAAEAADEGVEGADIDLLNLSPEDNFSQGTISQIALSVNGSTPTLAPITGKKNQFTTSYDGTNAITVTGVTAALSIPATAGTNLATTDYTGPVVTDASGNVVKDNVIAAQGTYTITITGAKNTQFAGATLSATLEVSAINIADAATAAIDVYNVEALADNANTWDQYQTAKAFTYTGEAQNIGVVYAPVDDKGDQGTPVALQEGVDYTVTYYIGGTETAVSSIENEGNYYARVTGIGKYSGTVNTGVFAVNPLKLAGSTDPAYTVSMVFGDGGYVYGSNTNLPTHPSAVKIGDKTYTNSNLLNAIVVDEWSDKNGATPAGRPGAFTGIAAAVENNDNVSGTQADVEVTRVGAEATIQYNGTNLESVTQPIVINAATNKDWTWSNSAITVLNGTTEIPETEGEDASATTNWTVTWTTADGKTFGADGKTAPTLAEPGEYVATIQGVDDGFEWAANGTLEITIISAVIDCDTNMTVFYNGNNVKDVNAIYDGDDVATDISVVLVGTDGKTVLTEANKDYAVTYKNADGEEVKTIKDAGTYTLEVTSDKYQLLNNTVAITVAPVDLTGLQMNEDMLDTVNGQKAFSYNDGDPIIVVPAEIGEDGTETASARSNVLEAIQFKTNATVAANTTNDPKADWEAVLTNPDTTNLPGAYTLTITNAEGKEIAPDQVKDTGTYTATVTLTNPDNSNYVITAGTCTFTVAVQQKFQDVPADAWYYDFVNDVTSTPLNYMKGYANTNTFGPNDSIIRGDVAVVLFRMAGGKLVADDFGDSDIDGFVTGFADCDATAETRGMYYNQAIAWAKANGIVTGYAGTDELRPQNNVTREEFATMLTRYAALSKDTSAANDLSKYPDGSTVSDWAKAAMEYVTAQGIMNGIGSTDEVLGPLAPQANVTRAEVAKMVYVEQPTRITPLV